MLPYKVILTLVEVITVSEQIDDYPHARELSNCSKIVENSTTKKRQGKVFSEKHTWTYSLHNELILKNVFYLLHILVYFNDKGNIYSQKEHQIQYRSVCEQ
jgi:hypothetical protein